MCKRCAGVNVKHRCGFAKDHRLLFKFILCDGTDAGSLGLWSMLCGQPARACICVGRYADYSVCGLFYRCMDHFIVTLSELQCRHASAPCTLVTFPASQLAPAVSHGPVSNLHTRAHISCVTVSQPVSQSGNLELPIFTCSNNQQSVPRSSKLEIPIAKSKRQ